MFKGTRAQNRFKMLNYSSGWLSFKREFKKHFTREKLNETRAAQELGNSLVIPRKQDKFESFKNVTRSKATVVHEILNFSARIQLYIV